MPFNIENPSFKSLFLFVYITITLITEFGTANELKELNTFETSNIEKTISLQDELHAVPDERTCLTLDQVFKLARNQTPEVLNAKFSLYKNLLQLQQEKDRRFPSLYIFPNTNFNLFGENDFSKSIDLNLTAYWDILSILYKDTNRYFSEQNYIQSKYHVAINTQQALLSAFYKFLNYLNAVCVTKLKKKQRNYSQKQYESLLFLDQFQTVPKTELFKAKLQLEDREKDLIKAEHDQKTTYLALINLLQLPNGIKVGEYEIPENILELPEYSELINDILKKSPGIGLADHVLVASLKEQKLALWKKWTNFSLQLSNFVPLNDDTVKDVKYFAKGTYITASWNIPLYSKGEQYRTKMNSKLEVAQAKMAKKKAVSKVIENINEIIFNFEKSKIEKRKVQFFLEKALEEQQNLIKEYSVGRVSKNQISEIHLKIDELKTQIYKINCDIIFRKGSIDILMGKDPLIWL